MYRRTSAFTLVELVMVIVITSILVVAIAPLLGRPFTIFQDQRTRALLIERAETAVSAIRREVRQAVPNSIRANNRALELMPAAFAGRYPYSDNAADIDALTPRRLDSNTSLMANIPLLTGMRAVVNPRLTPLLYAAAAGVFNGIMTPATTNITITNNGNQDRITLSAPFRFSASGNGSPSRRLFLTAGPVTYLCDGSQIKRFAGYSPSVAQPVSSTSPPLSGAASIALVVDGLTACQFRYTNGTSER